MTSVSFEVDGSQGEGGGQVLRAALALATILQKSIKSKISEYTVQIQAYDRTL